jgi:hypothetical protein
MNGDESGSIDVIEQMIADGSWIKLAAVVAIIAALVAVLNIFYRGR